jgi:peptidoglycan L-alanyl-D-glutamate endopeptidase CwlK
MSISYGPASRANIDQLDGLLQRILYRYADSAPPELDLSIICGHRGEAEQTRAFQTKKSKTPWPRSKHNRIPSWAFDFRPFPFPTAEHWKDGIRFGRIAGAILWVAAQEKVPVRWGGDWDQDGQTIDETFLDLGHVELIL